MNIPYAELHCHSYYTFLNSVSSPASLAQRAATLQLQALALTDQDGLYGVVPFYHKCREFGVQPILGAQVSLDDGEQIVLLCQNKRGYQHLSQLITLAHQGRPKGEPCATLEHLSEFSEGVLCLIGGKEGRLSQLLESDTFSDATAYLQSYRDIFGSDRLFIELTHNLDREDARRCVRLYQLARKAQLSYTATNGVHYASRRQGKLHDVLRCIQHRITLDASHHQRPGNHERYLKDAQQMLAIFREIPQALRNTCAIAERCQVELDVSQYRFPTFAVPTGHTPDSYLTQLCHERLTQKYPSITQNVTERLREELDLIQRLGLPGYFLTVWDIVAFAHSKGVPVQGRGSAANSLVAYLLDITPVDPIEHNLFLGRFLNEERTTLPDIDLDFAASREPTLFDREDIIQYVYEKYGAEYVAMVCTFVTFQARSAIREVGKVFEMPSAILDRMARLVEGQSFDDAFQKLAEMNEFRRYLSSPMWQHFKECVREIQDVPRHVSIHVGGMVIASCPLPHLVPLESARMPGRVVCQWDKDMIEDAGLIKIDLLGLGMLSVIRETLHWVERAEGKNIASEEIPPDDPNVYRMLEEADTVGVFQLESRAQMQNIPRTRPRNLTELAIQVALIRPGPLQGNMVEPYIRRKQGLEPVTYPHPRLMPILSETLGVILFQEQVLQVSVLIADFSPGEAETLRRALGKKRSREIIGKYRDLFLERAQRNGLSASEAEQIFGCLEGFAGYGFCKSHALSFAHLAYQSAWLRFHYPTAFFAALLNNQPMGFYPLEVLVQDTKRQGVDVRPVDVNHSQMRCVALKQDSFPYLQLGLLMVKGLSESHARTIVQAREREGAFASLRDFTRKTHLSSKVVERLILAGAADGFGLSRRELLWQLWILDHWQDMTDALVIPKLNPPQLPLQDSWDMLAGEYRAMGFSVDKHPLQLMREQLHTHEVLDSRQLGVQQDGTSVRVAGLVVCRQRPPTAKGVAFLTLEDEHGMVNVVIPSSLCESQRAAFLLAPMLLVEGKLRVQQDGILNVQAQMLSEIPYPK